MQLRLLFAGQFEIEVRQQLCPTHHQFNQFNLEIRHQLVGPAHHLCMTCAHQLSRMIKRRSLSKRNQHHLLLNHLCKYLCVNSDSIYPFS